MGREYSPQKKKERLLIALEKNHGIVTPACKDAKVQRSQYYDFYKNDPEFAKKVDELNEVTLDFVENQLLKKIEQGSEKSILFYMKYKARKRGYTDSVDITSGGEKINNIQIEIIKKKDDDINE